MIISDKCKLLLSNPVLTKVKIILLLFISINFSFAQKLNWIREHELHDNGYHWGVATCTDSQGNVYTSSVYRAAYQSLTIGGSFIRKYNKTGDLIWSYYKQALEVRSIVTDSNGNLYLSGNFCFNVNIGCSVLNDSVQPWTFFLAKFDPNGNCLWSKKVSNAWGTKIAIDENEFVYAIGGYFTPLQFETYHIQDGNMGQFVSKFDANGNCIWFNPIRTSMYISNIAVKNNNVAVTGQFYKKVFFGFDSLSFSIENNNEWDLDNVYTTLYSSEGALKWAKYSVNADYDVEANSIAIDKNNNVYVTGAYYNNADIEGRQYSIESYRDIYLIKYNEFGDTVLTTSFKGPNSEEGRAIYADDNGIFYSGICNQKLSIADTTINPGKASIFLAHLDFDIKHVKWLKTFGSSNGGHSEIFQLTSDNEGNLIAIGDYTNDLQVDSVHLVYNNNMYKKPFVMSIKENDQAIFVKKIPSVSSFKVYPTPSPGLITIVYKGNLISGVQIHIKNQLGQTLLTKTLPPQNEISETLDLSSFAKGIYFIELQSGEAVEVKKIVLE